MPPPIESPYPIAPRPPAPPTPDDRPRRLRIIGPILVVVAAFILGGIVYGIASALGADTDDAEAIAGVVGSAAILVFGWFAYRGLPRHERRLVLPSRGNLAIGILIGVGLAIGARIVLGLMLAIGQALDPGIEDAIDTLSEETVPPQLWHKLILVVALVVLAPLGEELVFRGLLLRGLTRRMTFAWAAIISGTIFALFHTQYFRLWPVGLGIAAFGIGAAYVYRWRGFPSNVAMHCVFNAFAAVTLFTDFGLDEQGAVLNVLALLGLPG